MRPREHYLQQLEDLHTELRALGQLVVTAITQAIDVLRRQDALSARHIINADHHIDQAQYTLEEHVLSIMATQQPMAGDLRRLIAAIEIASELERIGDYAKGIAKIAIRNADQPLLTPLNDIPAISQHAIGMLNSALDAFVQQDATAARALAQADDHVDTLSSNIRAQLLNLMQHDPTTVQQAVDLLSVTHNLERIADRTTNIAERVIFMVTGTMVELNP